MVKNRLNSLHLLAAPFFLLLMFAKADVKAQQFPDAQFGNIPDSVFRMQPPADNPEAPYVITNKELDVTFRESGESIMAVLQHHVRLKVFDDTAREASIIAIPYYFENDMERISSIEAYTYPPSGGRVPLSNEEIRTVNINSRYNVKEFEMPAVENGAVLEYRYVIERRYIEELPDFFLSDKVPIQIAKMTITYPKYLRYQPLVENYEGTIHHDFVYADTSSVRKVFTIPQPKPVVTERWIAYDIPAVEEEKFISTLDDYRAKIKFLLSEFGIPRQQLENSWEVVVARIREKTNPWESIRENKVAAAKGDSIAQALVAAPEEVVQDSIYRFLNERIQFSGTHRPFSTEPAKDVIGGEPADQAAINQTLVAMLRGAGIEANPVLISTRRAGKINMDFPSFYQFNGQMVQSRIGDQKYLMDASFPYSQPGLIPVDTYGSRGLVFKQDSFEWLDINPDKSIFDIDVEIDGDLHSDGTLSGKVEASQRGYLAQHIRQQKADGRSDAEILRQTIFDGYPEIKLQNVQIANIDRYDQPVQISAAFEIENYATSFTDGLRFRPMVVGYRSENPFESTDRNFPITLNAPEKLDLSYSISLPAGFSVEGGVQSNEVSLPGADFEESYAMGQGKMNYEYRINISQKDFSTDFFPQLYNLYKRWVELSSTTWLIES